MAIEKQKIIEIIERHKGSQLFIVARKPDGITLHNGVLQSASLSGVSIAEAEGGRILSIPFEKDGGENIFHIYNTQNIDLLKAKATLHLAAKLSDKENKKIIFSRLRPQINNDLFFVYKQQTSINVSSGRFVDMGMMGIVLKIAPFYNKDINLNYNTVFHIYTKDLVDLLK